MILGHVTVTDGAVNTHRDSYLLQNLTVVSVRRPFFAGAILFSIGALAFAAAFSDLLHLYEIACLVGFAILSLLAGHTIAQLKLISRETKGTELAGAVWGQYRSLQNVRREIVASLRALPDSKFGGRVK
ncbi:MAG: hypothetical protein K0U74_05480 [Alphaproteobacteria bacterium]|nr:hypothetical protein [Alphaproteobacteria bacterium]